MYDSDNLEIAEDLRNQADRLRVQVMVEDSFIRFVVNLFLLRRVNAKIFSWSY